jgi:hypothetical protein
VVVEKISSIDDLLEDGTYSVEKYKERKAKHQAALSGIDLKLKELENTDFEENLEIGLKLPETLKGDCDDMPHTKRAEALKLMTERITIDQDDPYNLNIEWRKPWNALSNNCWCGRGGSVSCGHRPGKTGPPSWPGRP